MATVRVVPGITQCESQIPIFSNDSMSLKNNRRLHILYDPVLEYRSMRFYSVIVSLCLIAERGHNHTVTMQKCSRNRSRIT